MKLEYTKSNYSWIGWKVNDGGTEIVGEIDKSDAVDEMDMLLECVHELYRSAFGFNEQDLVNLLKAKLNIDITLVEDK